MGDTNMLAEIFSETGIIVIAVVIVVLFGSTQLPKLARSLGSAQSEFKKGLAEGAKDGESKDDSSVNQASDSKAADAKE